MLLENLLEVKSGLYKIAYIYENGKEIPVLKPNVSDEELLERDPYNEMLEKASEEEELKKNINIQQMISDYLTKNNLPTISQIKRQKGKREILGIMTNDHRKVLGEMIRHYKVANGITTDRSKKSGVMGIISSGENQIIEQMLQEYNLNKLNKNNIRK